MAIETFTAACEAVMRECPDQYAKAYASAWLTGEVKSRAYAYGEPIEKAERVQALYILNNMSNWRGPTAREVREVLKKASKRKE